MRKRVIVLAVVLVFALGITAQAAGIMRAPTFQPRIVFNGTTATCIATVTAENSDQISVTARLWNGGTCLETWRDSGTGRVSIQETASVTRGEVYRLSIDSTINGVAQAERSITKVCPE